MSTAHRPIVSVWSLFEPVKLASRLDIRSSGIIHSALWLLVTDFSGNKSVPPIAVRWRSSYTQSCGKYSSLFNLCGCNRKIRNMVYHFGEHEKLFKCLSTPFHLMMPLYCSTSWCPDAASFQSSLSLTSSNFLVLSALLTSHSPGSLSEVKRKFP